MKKTGNSDVTVILPTRNEEENISEVLQEQDQMGYRDDLPMGTDFVDSPVEKTNGSRADVGRGCFEA